MRTCWKSTPGEGSPRLGWGQERGKQGATSPLSVTSKSLCLKVVRGQAVLALPHMFLRLPAPTDHDECQDMACENGECVNTEGSFHCFCSPPLTLDLSQQRCVNSTSGMGQWAWGGGAAGGVDLDWGLKGLFLCHQRTCLTMTSTWTSAGKKSPITCAANPCTGAAPPTRNAAARMARPGASSVPCAPPRALVRGRPAPARREGRPCRAGWASGWRVPSSWEGGLERSRWSCLQSLLFGNEVGQARSSQGAGPSALPLPGAVSQGIARQAVTARSRAGPSFPSLSSLTEVYAQLCNVARIEAEREAGVHFRPGYEYGPGSEDLHYSLYGPDGAPFYNYLGPEDTIPEPPFPNTAGHPGDHVPGLESPLQPSELQPRYVASHPGLCYCKMGKRWAPALLCFHLLHLLITASRVRTGRGKVLQGLSGVAQGTTSHAQVGPEQLPPVN